MSDQDPEGFVSTEKNEDGGTTTVIYTGDGVGVHNCPGGITEDELLD